MKIYDISQEVFSCNIYPGDPRPNKETICSIEKGDLYNLTEFSMCAHNGTHIDAQLHFFEKGKAVDELDIDYFVGDCYVAIHNGEINAQDATEIYNKAVSHNAQERILIAGDCIVTEDAANVFADKAVKLLGNESQTVGPIDSPMAVHKILLGKNIVLLEGICLNDVPEGKYFLNCAPLNLSRAEGAPCRAILVDLEL